MLSINQTVLDTCLRRGPMLLSVASSQLKVGVDLDKGRIPGAVVGRFICLCCGFCFDACCRRLRTRVLPGLQHNEPGGAGERGAPRLDEAIAGMVGCARLLSQTRVEQR